MANHKGAAKKARSDEEKRARNRYQLKTVRTYVKKLRMLKDKAEAEKMLIEVTSMLDRLAKRNVIHKNKASNQKSSLSLFVNRLA